MSHQNCGDVKAAFEDEHESIYIDSLVNDIKPSILRGQECNQNFTPDKIAKRARQN